MLSAASLPPAAGALLCLLLAARADAHDTWFAVAPSRAGGEAVLALGTGNQFPLQESGVATAYLQRSGCRLHDGSRVALDPLREGPTALTLRTASRGRAAAQGLSCWAQLVPLEIEIEPAKVAVYLDEIDAPAAARKAWAGLQARGIVWKERYVKSARVEIGAGTTEPLPAPLGLDVLLDAGEGPVRAGSPLVFQVLRDGKPLAGLALELRSEQGATWHRSDADGRVRLRAPAPGRWVLRGTDLRLSPTDAERWESRFLTLAFEVAEGTASRTAPARD
ncbi:MAG TPA: DUF4198 domain-containing protein [Rubrivivax sp.]